MVQLPGTAWKEGREARVLMLRRQVHAATSCLHPSFQFKSPGFSSEVRSVNIFAILCSCVFPSLPPLSSPHSRWLTLMPKWKADLAWSQHWECSVYVSVPRKDGIHPKVSLGKLGICGFRSWLGVPPMWSPGSSLPSASFHEWCVFYTVTLNVQPRG